VKEFLKVFGRVGGGERGEPERGGAMCREGGEVESIPVEENWDTFEPRASRVKRD